MLNSGTVRKAKLALTIIVGLLMLIGVTFFVVAYFKPKVAGIHIETSPPASVFIDDIEVGRTPYDATRDTGEIVVKLIPESFQNPLVPYETKVNLAAGVQVVIKQDFGETEEASSFEIISFEKISKNETSLTVVTVPDSAQLELDARDRAFTPYKTSVLPGEHTLFVSAKGYKERVVQVKTHQGYNLTAFVKLSKTEDKEEEIPVVTPQPETEKKEMVEILATSTGFLRVRAEPSTLGQEVGRVEPENTYPFIDVDEKTGWFKIEYESDKEGWVSNQYAKRIEGSSNLTPTPTKKVSPTPSPKVTPKPTVTSKPSPIP